MFAAKAWELCTSRFARFDVGATRERRLTKELRPVIARPPAFDGQVFFTFPLKPILVGMRKRGRCRQGKRPPAQSADDALRNRVEHRGIDVVLAEQSQFDGDRSQIEVRGIQLQDRTPRGPLLAGEELRNVGAPYRRALRILRSGESVGDLPCEGGRRAEGFGPNSLRHQFVKLGEHRLPAFDGNVRFGEFVRQLFKELFFERRVTVSHQRLLVSSSWPWPKFATLRFVRRGLSALLP